MNKFDTIPEGIFSKINEERDESILRGWLNKAMICTSTKDLEVT